MSKIAVNYDLIYNTANNIINSVSSSQTQTIDKLNDILDQINTQSVEHDNCFSEELNIVSDISEKIIEKLNKLIELGANSLEVAKSFEELDNSGGLLTGTVAKKLQKAVGKIDSKWAKENIEKISKGAKLKLTKTLTGAETQINNWVSKQPSVSKGSSSSGITSSISTGGTTNSKKDDDTSAVKVATAASSPLLALASAAGIDNETIEKATNDTKNFINNIMEDVKDKYNEYKTTLTEKQPSALDTAIIDANKNNNNQTSNPTQNTTEIGDKVDAAKTEINNNISNAENKLTDKMEEVKQTVEEKSKPVTPAQPTTTTKVVEKPVVKQTPTKSVEKAPETPKTVTTPAPTKPVEKTIKTPTPTEKDPNISDDGNTGVPEPKHTTIPKDDTTIVKTVPKPETSKNSSTSSGNASKVIPVIAGVAAAGAAGVGTKIYLDSKSAPENKYINEEFVVDDSDYTASHYESAEIGNDETDLLKEETYRTRANSETTDESKEDKQSDAIADDMTYGMNFQDNDITFDETTPYEAIDNYEIGETH